MIHCFKCKKSLKIVSLLLWHLKRGHAIYSNFDIPCGQNDCPKMCSSLRNLQLQITKHHTDLLELSDSININVPYSTAVENSHDDEQIITSEDCDENDYLHVNGSNL